MEAQEVKFKLKLYQVFISLLCNGEPATALEQEGQLMEPCQGG